MFAILNYSNLVELCGTISGFVTKFIGAHFNIRYNIARTLTICESQDVLLLVLDGDSL
jgi:hypothetical protein